MCAHPSENNRDEACAAHVEEPEPMPGLEAKDEEMVDEEKKEEERRESKRLLWKATVVPEWLLERYTIPDLCSITHTLHKDKSLPHFQGRLPSGRQYNGKTLE